MPDTRKRGLPVVLQWFCVRACFRIWRIGSHARLGVFVIVVVSGNYCRQSKSWWKNRLTGYPSFECRRWTFLGLVSDGVYGLYVCRLGCRWSVFLVCMVDAWVCVSTILSRVGSALCAVGSGISVWWGLARPRVLLTFSIETLLSVCVLVDVIVLLT